MTAVSNNVCFLYVFYMFTNIADKYNNTYHNTIKMKPNDVKSYTYAEYNVDSNA